RLIFSPRGSQLAVVRSAGTVAIYDLEHTNKVTSLATTGATESSTNIISVRVLAWRSDGKRLVASDSAGTVSIWETASGALLYTLKQEATMESDPWSQVAFNSNGSRIAIFSSGAGSSRDRVRRGELVTVCNAESGKELFRVP